MTATSETMRGTISLIRLGIPHRPYQNWMHRQSKAQIFFKEQTKERPQLSTIFGLLSSPAEFQPFVGSRPPIFLLRFLRNLSQAWALYFLSQLYHRSVLLTMLIIR